MARPKKPTFKNAVLASLFDTMDVVLYTGVPATGVVTFLNLLSEDIPTIAKYAPYMASTINVLVFFVKRFYEYYKGKRKIYS